MKINKSLSKWTKFLHGLSQGSFLDTFHFNNIQIIYFSYIIFQKYVIFQTFFAYDKEFGSPINRIEHGEFLAIEWFQNNYMKLSKEMCHLLIAGQK